MVGPDYAAPKLSMPTQWAGANAVDETTTETATPPSLGSPIFPGGRLKAAVEVALFALARERIRNQKLTESMEAYRQAATLSRSLYQTGSSSFLDSLDAERSLYSAEDAFIQSRVSITKNYVALCKALGGGWDGAIDASKPEIIDTDTGPRSVARNDPRS